MTLLPRTDGAGWPWGWPAAGRRSMRSDYACLPQGEQEGEKVRISSPRNQSGDRRITQTASSHWTEGSGETGSGQQWRTRDSGDSSRAYLPSEWHPPAEALANV